MDVETIRQCIWEGHLAHSDMHLRIQWDLKYLDKRLVPAASLRCWLSLADCDGSDVYLCRRCMDDGLSTPVSYSELRSIGLDPVVHTMQCDIVVHCNGEVGHDPRRPLSLWAVVPRSDGT